VHHVLHHTALIRVSFTAFEKKVTLST